MAGHALPFPVEILHRGHPLNGLRRRVMRRAAVIDRGYEAAPASRAA